MSAFHGGILIGVFVGANLAIVLIGLLVIAKCGEFSAWTREKLNGSSVPPRLGRRPYLLDELIQQPMKSLPFSDVIRKRNYDNSLTNIR